MNAKTLYDIYENTQRNDFKDLIFGLGQYHADHPGEIDHATDKAIREFIGKHGQDLSIAYHKGYAAFVEAFELCVTQDKQQQ